MALTENQRAEAIEFLNDPDNNYDMLTFAGSLKTLQPHPPTVQRMHYATFICIDVIEANIRELAEIADSILTALESTLNY